MSRRGLRHGVAQRAPTAQLREAGGMADDRPVIVYPPDEQGGRRVQIVETVLGRAYSVRDVAAFIQEAGLPDFDEMDVVRSALIEWRGGGPDVWTH